MSDDTTRTRFLAAIAAQLPAAHVMELHLFGAVRQGGIENGLAVIAVDRDTPRDDVPPALAAAMRYTVYTARYRHTLKGPERGRWDASIMEEADAPLLTIDAVVRGVARRSGEADDTVRLSGDEFRAALPDPLPATATVRPAAPSRRD